MPINKEIVEFKWEYIHSMEYFAPLKKKKCRPLHFILHSGIQDRYLGLKKKSKLEKSMYDILVFI